MPRGQKIHVGMPHHQQESNMAEFKYRILTPFQIVLKLTFNKIGWPKKITKIEVEGEKNYGFGTVK